MAHAHDHQIGADVFGREVGPAGWKYPFGNLVSGRGPSAQDGALSLMCVAKKIGPRGQSTEI